jgi:hypothetical protein
LPGRTAVVAAVTAAVVASAVAVPAAAAAAPQSSGTHARASTPAHEPGSYIAITQFRALSARTVLAAGHSVTVHLARHHSIPANAAAVAITVHAIGPRGNGMLTVSPSGSAVPKAITVSYRSGHNSAQSTVARLAQGAISIVNRAPSGSTHVAVDVAGYYAGGAVGRAQPGQLHALRAPIRALDTRGHSPLPAHGVRTFRIGHGVPSSGVGAVAVALTTFDPAVGWSLIAYAAGNDQPTSPSASFAAHRSNTTFAWVPTRSDGSISVANTAGRPVAFAVDVVGWVDAGVARQAGALEPRFPDRLVDHSPVLSGRTRTVPVAGSGGVPLAGVRAAVVQLTASAATRAGSLTAWPGGGQGPTTSVLDYAPGSTVSDLAAVPLSGGALHIKNVSSGSVQLSVDVVGFVLAGTLTPPPTSISRYLGDLTGDDTKDVQTMRAHGCADAKSMLRAGSRFVLLDVGAQTITPDQVSGVDPDNPGVLLTQTVSTVRLTYPDLVSRLQSYADAFANCGKGRQATIAIGTNNDGAWDPNGDNYYAPAARGKDWAYSVVNMLTSAQGVTFTGANDIEPGFAAGQTQSLSWEKNYLKWANEKRLVFNGSADGCPDGFGQTSAECSDGYTQQGLYQLASLGGQVVALPQIYGPSMAAQWANIDRVGGGEIVFGGVLTEHALAPDSYTPPNGWAAMHHALGTLQAKPSLPAVSDITSG